MEGVDSENGPQVPTRVLGVRVFLSLNGKKSKRGVQRGPPCAALERR